MIRRLLDIFTLGRSSSVAVERYEGAESFHIDRSQAPFDLYDFDAWVGNLSERGLIVSCFGRDYCDLTASDVRTFQGTFGDPEIEKLDLHSAAVAAAIFAVLGTDQRFPVDILVDPNVK